MSESIKVFWYCEKWQPGGIQAVQVNLLRHMPEIQFDIVVSEDDTDLFDQRLADAGARKLVTLNRRYSGPGMRTLANFFAVSRLLRTGGYDVAHFNACHGVELMYVFWAWLHRIPMRIVHCRNNDIGAGGRSRKLKIACHEICKRLFGWCANVRLANSDLAAKWLFTARQHRLGKVRVLKNGVDCSRFVFNAAVREQVRGELGLKNAFVVGHIGHFSYQKNHAFLLEIFAELKKQVPSAKLLLIGEGDGEAAARQQAEALGIAQDVLFYGVTNDIPSLLWAMDAFVLPSRFEGFGNVLIEAQAAGLRCFASRGVIPQAVRVTDNLTWLSLDDPPRTWAKAISGCASPYPHKDDTADIARSGYDISSMAAELTALYQDSRKKK